MTPRHPTPHATLPDPGRRRALGALTTLAGAYRMERGFGITLRMADGALTSQASFEAVPEELVPVAPGAFVGLTRGWRFEVTGDSLAIIPGPGARIRGARQ